MAVPVSALLPIQDPGAYKLHAARLNYEHNEPLDLFLQNKEKWQDWNRYRHPKREDFNRRYIFSMMRFYPNANKSIWLFGGIFEVKGKNGYGEHGYDSILTDYGSNLIGRLKIEVVIKSQGRAYLLETFWPKMSVYELLAEPYSGAIFPGYDKISPDFRTLETIIKNEPADWKTALENVKGIYCIADKANGKCYVGSAYGNTGIWARWRHYMQTGHGHNKQLKILLKEAGAKAVAEDIAYARENFKFTLLELYAFKTGDDSIIQRENFWKEALLTRQYGYNDN